MKISACVFLYNRSDKARLALNALKRCNRIDEISIKIFIDPPKKNASKDRFNQLSYLVDRFIIDNQNLKVEKIVWKNHAGPFISLTKGIQVALEECDAALRIEDDVVVREDYIEYMIEALEKYKDDEHIFCIAAYNPQFVCEKSSIFSAKTGSFWGMGIWKNRFEKIDFCMTGEDISPNTFSEIVRYRARIEEKDLFGSNRFNLQWTRLSEDYMMLYHIFENDLRFLGTNASLVRNIGLDGSGTHDENIEIRDTNFNKKITNCSNTIYDLNESECIEYINYLCQ